ncbi:MAG: glycosyl hydrolase 53 family protein [Bacteroidota bacterium]
MIYLYPRFCSKLLFLLAALLVTVLLPEASRAQTVPFIHGADISYIEELEANGAVFKEAGIADDLFAILARNGINTIRLRIWHTPAQGWYDLESTIAAAKRTKAAGMDLLLDFHYSDTWADPGRQTKPAAWQGIPFEILRDSLYAYTYDVMDALKAEDVMPRYVQVGNETSQGMLWDEGRVGGSFNSAAQWSKLRTLFSDAIRAIRDVAAAEDVEIILHTDRGGDVGGATWFFDNITSSGTVDFDMIGLSYYPWWHGSLEAMEQTVNTVAAKYKKPVFIAETAYPWTLQWYDNTNNLVGLPEHLLPGYETLPDAQYTFLRDVLEVVRNIPEGRGAGISYWAPEFMAVPGVGSVWENVALFDNNGELLPAINAFAEQMPTSLEENNSDIAGAFDVFPNPARQAFEIRYQQENAGNVRIVLYDTLGREVQRIVDQQWLASGRHQFETAVTGLAAGTYLCVVYGPEGRMLRRIILW